MPSRKGIRRQIGFLTEEYKDDLKDLGKGNYPKNALRKGSVSLTRKALTKDYKHSLKRKKSLLASTRSRKPKRKGVFQTGP